MGAKRSRDDMYEAIDLLAKAMPDGQLFAAMGPKLFLGAAADRIKTLETALLVMGHAYDNDNRPPADTLGLIADIRRTRIAEGGTHGTPDGKDRP